MRRYSAWHKTEPGFDTAKEVETWIARQETPSDWYIVATDDDFQLCIQAEKIRLDNYSAIIRNAVNDTLTEERNRIIKLLGLKDA